MAVLCYYIPMYKTYPTKPELEDVFDYDGNEGIFYWKKPTSIRVKKGGKVGYKNKYGYLVTSIKKSEYYIHRLVWVMHHGSIPQDKQIDHIDRNPLNNKISNLRLVSDAENKLNLPMRKTNRSGHRGVHWDKERKKWFAQIQRNKKTTALGRFDNLEDAVEARRQAEAELA